MSDELKGFKISDQVRQRVDRPGGSSSEGPAVESSSAGFPRIEGLLEGDKLDLSGFGERMGQLQELATAGSNKEKAGAKKAAIAYERVTDLLNDPRRFIPYEDISGQVRVVNKSMIVSVIPLDENNIQRRDDPLDPTSRDNG